MGADHLLDDSPIEPRGSTFLVKIMYTQHTSAQGNVQWIEQEKVLSFRSFMELIHLLEEALQSKEGATKLRTWEEANKLRSEWR